MQKKVIETIKKYNLIEKNDKIVIGVSGGPDSICLLDILNKLKEKLQIELIVVHVNHCIREEAIEDEKYVEQYCKRNQIKFYAKRIDVLKIANNSKMGIEETGRALRYQFFDEVMQNENANKIAIAHNKNDKAETVIMNMIRGTGISGLKGIEVKRENKYIRPLIECERREIEEYCKKENLNPRIDKTNFDNEYTRNKIRNIAIPYIEKEFNPNIIETINRLSDVATETEDYLKNETKKEYEKIKISEQQEKIILDLKQFNTKHILIKKRIILYTIEKLLGNSLNIEKVNIDDIIKLCQNNIGNKYLKPNKKIKILVNKGKIFFEVSK